MLRFSVYMSFWPLTLIATALNLWGWPANETICGLAHLIAEFKIDIIEKRYKFYKQKPYRIVKSLLYDNIIDLALQYLCWLVRFVTNKKSENSHL